MTQNQMSEFRESKKMKVVQLHEWSPKQFLKPTMNQKIANQHFKKVKNNLNIKSRSNVKIEGNKANNKFC